jgi:hypothetical protein
VLQFGGKRRIFQLQVALAAIAAVVAVATGSPAVVVAGVVVGGGANRIL